MSEWLLASKKWNEIKGFFEESSWFETKCFFWYSSIKIMLYVQLFVLRYLVLLETSPFPIRLARTMMIGGFKLPLYDNIVSGILARLWGCDVIPLLCLKMESFTIQTKYISMLKWHSDWYTWWSFENIEQSGSTGFSGNKFGQKRGNIQSCSKLPQCTRGRCRSHSARAQGSPVLLRAYSPTQLVSCSAR